MRIAAIAAAVAGLLVTPAAHAGFFDEDCRYTAPRNATTPAAGITRVIVKAEAGSLQVTGTAGAAQVAVRGTACTSDEEFLSRVSLVMRKSGSDLVIESRVPRRNVVFGFFSARLDVEITLPAGMPVEIEDDSGWIKVANSGETSIIDGSGSIDVRGVRGNLVIRDGSGAIEVEDVTGDVTIDDASGSIRVVQVQGAVQIEDGSGSIAVERVGSLRIIEDGSGGIVVQHVRGDVVIDEDGSGTITVSDVGGRFRVLRKGSGSITHERVGGGVELPRR